MYTPTLKLSKLPREMNANCNGNGHSKPLNGLPNLSSMVREACSHPLYGSIAQPLTAFYVPDDFSFNQKSATFPFFK